MDCSVPSFPVPHHLLYFAQVHVYWISNAIKPSNSLLSPLLLPSVFPSMRVFCNESALCIGWPKYWSFSFSISPCNEYSGLFSFRIDSFDLLAVQGTLKSLLQHHSSKASIIQHSALFTVQLSHPEVTSLFLFTSVHDWAESLEVVSGGCGVHHLPRLLAFWLKSPFLSANICPYWFCKQWPVGSDLITWITGRGNFRFYNTFTYLNVSPLFKIILKPYTYFFVRRGKNLRKGLDIIIDWGLTCS